MEVSSYVVLCLVLVVTHLVQGITGFGAVILALPILTFFFPVKTLIPALVVVNFAQTLWFAVTERKHIHRKHAKSLLILSLIGLPFGYATYTYLPSEDLKTALGVFVLVVAVWNLSGIELKRKPPLSMYHGLNLLGGYAQGAVVSGGPFLVIYAAKMLKDKSAFRATLSLVWTVLNLILCVTYTVAGSWNKDMIPIIGFAMPTVVVGTVFGIILHRKVPQKPFRTLIFVLLLMSGLVLLQPLLMNRL